MNDHLKKLEEQWKKDDETEEQDLEDALHQMESLIYASRSIKIPEGSNVKVTEIKKKEKDDKG